MGKITKSEFDKLWEECFPKEYVDVPGYFNNGKGFVMFYSPELWDELWDVALKESSKQK